MSVLIVTGAAGWLGQNLVADVREGAVQAAAKTASDPLDSHYIQWGRRIKLRLRIVSAILVRS